MNWDYINQHKGKFKKKQKLEAYKHEHIQKLLEICDHRTRCIVLIFASTGIRIGYFIILLNFNAHSKVTFSNQNLTDPNVLPINPLGSVRRRTE